MRFRPARPQTTLHMRAMTPTRDFVGECAERSVMMNPHIAAIWRWDFNLQLLSATGFWSSMAAAHRVALVSMQPGQRLVKQVICPGIKGLDLLPERLLNYLM